MVVVDEFNEMGFNAFFFQFTEQHGADFVVDHAFAFDGAALFAVECGSVVFVLYHVQRVIAGFENFLCFAFIQLFQYFYCHN